MRGIPIEAFERGHAAAVGALRAGSHGDWDVRAGTLTWTAALTAAHLTDVLYSYAFQAATFDLGEPGGQRGELPFDELHARPGATPDGLVNGIHASGVLLAAMLRAMPVGATASWHGREVGAAEWAAMGARETLLHAFDIACGIGVPFTAPGDVVAHLLEPPDALDAPGGARVDDAWAALVRSSGRPYGEEEMAEWRAVVADRRSRPAPAGSEDGLVSNFDDGTTATAFGAGWRASSDQVIGGSSTAEIEVVTGGRPGSTHCLRLAGEVRDSAAQLTWGGAVVFTGEKPREPANVSAKRELRFWARCPGEWRELAVWAMTESSGGLAGRHTVKPDGGWQPFRIPLGHVGTDGSDLQGLMFVADMVAGPFVFELDDVRFD